MLARLLLGKAAEEEAGVGVVVLLRQLAHLQIALQAHLGDGQRLLKGLLHNLSAILACAHQAGAVFISGQSPQLPQKCAVRARSALGMLAKPI